MTLKKFAPIFALVFLVPLAASAQLTNTRALIVAAQGLVTLLIILAGALALLAFIWGLVKFILAAGNPAKKAEGKAVMVWGIIALFVMVSVWGIIQILQQDFLGGRGGGVIPIPGASGQVSPCGTSCPGLPSGAS